MWWLEICHQAEIVEGGSLDYVEIWVDVSVWPRWCGIWVGQVERMVMFGLELDGAGESGLVGCNMDVETGTCYLPLNPRNGQRSVCHFDALRKLHAPCSLSRPCGRGQCSPQVSGFQGLLIQPCHASAAW